MELIAQVNESGTGVKWEAPAKFQAVLKKHAGKKVAVAIRKPREKRSLDMNAYLHRWPFKLLAEHFGDSIEGTKLDLMGHFFGWTTGPISGRPVPIKPHTSDMSKEESAAFLDWLIPWAKTEHGVSIPLPNEAPIDDEDAA